MIEAPPRVRAALCLIAVALVLGGATLGLRAQQRATGTAAFETIEIRPHVFVIFGAGGNIVMHVGEDGVILVDTGSAASADKLLATVKGITDEPIRLIINTNADADHAGGNAVIANAGTSMINRDTFGPANQDHATLLAHENVLRRMSASSGNGSAFPDEAWPDTTYTQRVKKMYLNEDAVLVMRELGAHSDGDSIVQFRRADVIVAGDIIDLRHFPVIDAKIGGSIDGELEALNNLLELTVPAEPMATKPGRTLLVPGHGRISDYAELVEYRDMVTIIRDIIQDLIGKGMTLEQVKATNPTRPFARYGSNSGPWTTDMFVEAIYTSLKSRAAK